MRSAFTMIEIIFVMVILGILSAVALPKFLLVADNADATKCKAFVGTLNRTVSHSLWADAFFNDRENLATSMTEAKIDEQIETPSSCGTSAKYATAATDESSFTIRIAETDYNVTGFAPTSTTPAKWIWTQQ